VAAEGVGGREPPLDDVVADPTFAAATDDAAAAEALAATPAKPLAVTGGTTAAAAGAEPVQPLLDWRMSARAHHFNTRRPPAVPPTPLTEHFSLVHVAHGCAPGGDLAEALLVLAALDRARRQATGEGLRDVDVEAIFCQIVDSERVSAYYYYTDENALHNACARLGVETLHFANPAQQVPALSEEVLLGAMTAEETIGSEHLRLLLREPARFGVPRALTQALLAAFFKMLWNPETRGAKLRVEVLCGSRPERVASALASDAVAHSAPGYHPRHPRAARADILQLLADQLWIRPADIPRLRTEAGCMALEHYELTRSELAKGLATPVTPMPR